MHRTLGVLAGAHTPCALAVTIPIISVGSNWYGLAYVSDFGVVASLALLAYIWWVRAHSFLFRPLITGIFLATLPIHVVLAQMDNAPDCLTARSLDYTWWWIMESPEGPIFYLERTFGSSSSLCKPRSRTNQYTIASSR